MVVTIKITTDSQASLYAALQAISATPCPQPYMHALQIYFLQVYAAHADHYVSCTA